MSARIKPTVIDSIAIGFSTQHPRFERDYSRPEDEAAAAAPVPAPHGVTQPIPSASNVLPPDEMLAAELLFETARLAAERPSNVMSPLEIARRLNQDWQPPAGGFSLADKSI